MMIIIILLFQQNIVSLRLINIYIYICSQLILKLSISVINTILI